MTVFGTAHTLILLAIIALSAVLAWASRRSNPAARVIRLSLGSFLAVNELVWYAFRYTHEGFRFPEGLPIELCDVVVWIAVAACLRRNVAATEFLYFAGLGGSGMALLTPDLWAPLASYPSIYFFLAHGGVVISAVTLVAGGQVRLRPQSLWRVLGLLSLYAAAIGIFNLVFHTNYFYLCHKPENPSILDWFGPWPVYIAVAALFTLATFGLMWLPVRLFREQPEPSPAARQRM